MQYAAVYQADTLQRLDAERGLVVLERRRLRAERLAEFPPTWPAGTRRARWAALRARLTHRRPATGSQAHSTGIVAR